MISANSYYLDLFSFSLKKPQLTNKTFSKVELNSDVFFFKLKPFNLNPNIALPREKKCETNVMQVMISKDRHPL